MTSEEREKMKRLCRLIQDESDPEKFTELIRELYEFLDRKELHLNRQAQ